MLNVDEVIINDNAPAEEIGLFLWHPKQRQKEFKKSDKIPVKIMIEPAFKEGSGC